MSSLARRERVFAMSCRTVLGRVSRIETSPQLARFFFLAGSARMVLFFVCSDTCTSRLRVLRLVSFVDEEGKEVILGIEGAGGFLGEIALLDH